MTDPKYKCDGADDNEQIQAALDALPSGGGKVVLSEGTFNIATSASLTNSQALIGMGKDATILRAVDNFNSDVLVTPTDVFQQYITVQSLRIDGNRGNNTSGKGINFFAPEYCIIRDCRIIETDEEAIFFEGDGSNQGFYNYILYNQIRECDVGVVMSTNCEQNYILYNVIHHISAGRGFQGLTALDHVLHNTFENCSGITIRVAFGAGAWNIIGNTIDAPQDDAIVIDGADDCVVAYNHISGAGGLLENKVGITNSNSSDDLLCIGNRIVESGATGTVGIKELAATARCTYRDNNLTGPAVAMSLHGSSTVRTVRNNTGHITENSGTATLVNDQTSIAVTHGLDVTPGVGDVMITPIEAWGSAVNFWISAYSSTTFTITVDQAPGQDVDFAWKAVAL